MTLIVLLFGDRRAPCTTFDGGDMDIRSSRVAIAAVLLLSTFAVADTIGDPGGIIRNGWLYDQEAIIGPGFAVTFNGINVSSFNPYDPSLTGFCKMVTFGEGLVPDCRYENQSGQTITSFAQQFSATAAAFDAAGGISCINQITPGACTTPGGNALFFTGLNIPTASAEYTSVLSALYGGYSTINSPDFNVVYFGFGDNHQLADIAFTSSTIPEPGSLFLVLSALGAMGIQLKRRNRWKTLE